MKKDLLTIKHLTGDDILSFIDRGLEIKRSGRNTDRPLRGCTLGLIFEKASTRTRVSFETAMTRLGGHTLFLSREASQLSRDEPIKDTARVLSRYVDALAVRTFSQAMVEEMAQWSKIPVINALTDRYHPCQILSDLMTVKEKRGSLENMKVAWVGDGNNVAHSWISAARILGFRLVLACPEGYEPMPEELEGAGDNIRVVRDPREAATDAHVINTDVWTSMGQDAERDRRLKDFQGFQVDEALVSMAKPEALIMHCLPAHRGEEIAEGVMEGPNSVIFDQAENKMHLHQALLEMLIAGP
ncbi:MAG: ornithine carbamoyltransferase [Deltaproteobacteria bacterium]|nr:ornithine carbamoyltransferase [Deltaproteobacteria bacterium]